jgi:predicted metal-dependent RNase
MDKEEALRQTGYQVYQMKVNVYPLLYQTFINIFKMLLVISSSMVHFHSDSNVFSFCLSRDFLLIKGQLFTCMYNKYDLLLLCLTP